MGAACEADWAVAGGSSIGWHIARGEIKAITIMARAMRTARSEVTGVLSVIPKMLQVFLAIALSSAAPSAQQRGVVVDQTGLPLPGAHVEVHRGERVVASFDTGLDGGFELPAFEPTDTLHVSPDGFEAAHVPPAEAAGMLLT